MLPYIERLFSHHPLVFAHLVLALGALVLGAAILLRRKGDRLHRWWGWCWVVLMGGTGMTSAFMRDELLPNIAGITPIHLFTVLVAYQLPRGIWHIRHGRVEAHRQTMRGLYLGGCALAGLFTLLPGRFLGTLLWKHGLGLLG